MYQAARHMGTVALGNLAFTNQARLHGSQFWGSQFGETVWARLIHGFGIHICHNLAFSVLPSLVLVAIKISLLGFSLHQPVLLQRRTLEPAFGGFLPAIVTLHA